MLLPILRHAMLSIFQNFDGKGYFLNCSKTAIFLGLVSGMPRFCAIHPFHTYEQDSTMQCVLECGVTYRISFPRQLSNILHIDKP